MSIYVLFIVVEIILELVSRTLPGNGRDGSSLMDAVVLATSLAKRISLGPMMGLSL